MPRKEKSFDTEFNQRRDKLKEDWTRQKQEWKQQLDLELSKRKEAVENEISLQRKVLEEERETFDNEIAQQRDEALHRLEEERNELEIEIDQLLEQQANYNADRQMEALRNLLGRPWRQDQEAVSAAFSKWVRVTMFENAQEEKSGLENAQTSYPKFSQGTRDQ